jgi:hypothetical protein
VGENGSGVNSEDAYQDYEYPYPTSINHFSLGFLDIKYSLAKKRGGAGAPPVEVSDVYALALAALALPRLVGALAALGALAVSFSWALRIFSAALPHWTRNGRSAVRPRRVGTNTPSSSSFGCHISTIRKSVPPLGLRISPKTRMLVGSFCLMAWTFLTCQSPEDWRTIRAFLLSPSWTMREWTASGRAMLGSLLWRLASYDVKFPLT